MSTYINYYYCQDCGVGWTDVWSCACDDECMVCGKDWSPYEYEVIEEEDEEQ